MSVIARVSPGAITKLNVSLPAGRRSMSSPRRTASMGKESLTPPDSSANHTTQVPSDGAWSRTSLLEQFTSGMEYVIIPQLISDRAKTGFGSRGPGRSNTNADAAKPIGIAKYLSFFPNARAAMAATTTSGIEAETGINQIVETTAAKPVNLIRAVAPAEHASKPGTSIIHGNRAGDIRPAMEHKATMGKIEVP